MIFMDDMSERHSVGDKPPYLETEVVVAIVSVIDDCRVELVCIVLDDLMHFFRDHGRVLLCLLVYIVV